jgi:hypothetical protein
MANTLILGMWKNEIQYPIGVGQILGLKNLHAGIAANITTGLHFWISCNRPDLSSDNPLLYCRDIGVVCTTRGWAVRLFLNTLSWPQISRHLVTIGRNYSALAKPLDLRASVSTTLSFTLI